MKRDTKGPDRLEHCYEARWAFGVVDNDFGAGRGTERDSFSWPFPLPASVCPAVLVVPILGI